MVEPLHGYHGRYLQIDLAQGSGHFIPLSSDVLRRFLGGSGLGVYLLLKHGGAAFDPFSPAAPLAFVFSPLVGSPITTSAKFAVVSRSPLTQRINDSLASSGFALAGKKSGCDALLLLGRAPELSVLVVDDGRVTLEPAGNLAGAGCAEAQQRLRTRFGEDFRFCVIGPAGERRVRYATLSHDGRHAGRGGSGAVLGAKNVKAIAVRGTRRCSWAHPDELAALAKRISEKSFGPATAKYRELGTVANLLVFNRLHALPTRNFQQGHFEGAAAFAPETLELRHEIRASCVACTIGCEHIYSFRAQGKTRGRVRLEYENLFSLGPLCGVDDPEAVLEASLLCDELGIDTISAGGTIAFAMECVERGLLDAPWLRFGDGEAVLRALQLIGSREGLGDGLADGSRLLAQRIGRDALSFAPQVKGLEIPGYEPRALQTMALGLAVGTRGADHNRSSAYEADFSGEADRFEIGPQAAGPAIAAEDRAAILDSLILCKFLRGVLQDFYAETAEILHRITGWHVTADEMRCTARRIVTAKKLFNIQAGWRPDEDILPDRFFRESLPEEPDASLSRERFQEAVAAYNRGRDWTAEGWPTVGVLAELGLQEFAASVSSGD